MARGKQQRPPIYFNLELC